jgi:hypothetical protein
MTGTLHPAETLDVVRLGVEGAGPCRSMGSCFALSSASESLSSLPKRAGVAVDCGTTGSKLPSAVALSTDEAREELKEPLREMIFRLGPVDEREDRRGVAAVAAAEVEACPASAFVIRVGGAARWGTSGGFRVEGTAGTSASIVVNSSCLVASGAIKLSLPPGARLRRAAVAGTGPAGGLTPVAKEAGRELREVDGSSSALREAGESLTASAYELLKVGRLTAVNAPVEVRWNSACLV